MGACAPSRGFGELAATRTGQYFILQGGDGGGRLVDHIVFAGGAKDAGDEDEKACSGGSQSRTFGLGRECLWCPGAETRPRARIMEMGRTRNASAVAAATVTIVGPNVSVASKGVVEDTQCCSVRSEGSEGKKH